MQLTYHEIASVVHAKNNWQKWPDFTISSVEFDSRLLKEGSLFVPLKGIRDGHDFVENALQQGASATLWAREDVPKEFPTLVVEDTLLALQELARYYLKKMKPKVVAITGSNGKTTTKDMTEAILKQKYHTYKTQGNYNNHIGLPYTILHMPNETEILVLEMGMDHAGEISFLAKMGKPEIAAITLIGESHIENFGSRKGIAQAKMEMTEGLQVGGELIIPGDEPLLTSCVKEIDPSIKVTTFGLYEASDYYVTSIEEEKERTNFTMNLYPDKAFQIPVLGSYNARNALVAIAIGRHFGLDLTQIQRGLSTMKLTQNRTEWKKAKNGADILSDVYNANPTAMGLVLDTFSKLENKGKKLAVLGDMLELGDASVALHQQMKNHLNPDKIQEIYLFGPEMKNLFEELKKVYKNESIHYYSLAQKDQLIQDLQASLAPKDMVVLKASNGMKLEEIVQKIS